MNPKVDFFFENDSKWQKEYAQLRTIMLDCQLTEELKWGCPCYTHQNRNIALIHGFKDYCAILFMKGSLLQDPSGILIQQTKNVQVGRQVRFTNVKEIVKLKSILKAYIYEAIEVEKIGIQPKLKTTAEFEVCEEFQTKLKKTPGLKKAFEALTPGRQKGYLLHFSSAKQATTRVARVEKSIPQILAGKGLDD
jgi:uncharacterized protein YdeI (YjbR/CyaY-like superfamily)